MRKFTLLSFIFILFSIQLQAQGNDKDQSSSLDAGRMNISLGGYFIINGSFPAYASERADQFITRIFNETKIELLNSAKDAEGQNVLYNQFNEFPRRNILLKRFNGTVINLDLEKFRLTGDFKYNPYLSNDDVIIFPAIDMEKDFIEVSGAVNRNVKFQFVDGDKLSDALLFAQGIDKSYEGIGEAQISRLNYAGDKEEAINVKINDDFPLQKGDRIRVLGYTYNKKDYKVLVLGETRYQGYIYITKNNTTLKEVIEKAGGFTEKASLERAELIRNTSSSEALRARSIKEVYENKGIVDPQSSVEFEKMQSYERLSMLRMHNLYIEDTTLFALDNFLRLLYRSGGIDFSKVESENSEAGNFIVKDGDIILIPEKAQTVFVFGQVINPGYIQYKEGMNYNYYLTQAGGIGESAQNDIKIIKAKSRAWIEAGPSIVIEPGDYIYAPKEPKRSFASSLQTIAFVTSITSGIATLALVVYQIIKD